MTNSLKINFETFLNLAVIVCTVALIGFFGHHWFFSQIQQSNPDEEFAEGKFLAEVPNLNENNFEKSMVIILNADCKYCEESLDFYKRLANSKYDAKSRQLTALFLQPEEFVTKYVKDKEFSIRAIPDANFKELKVGLTPTIVAIDRQRQIIKSWFGKLEPDKEQEVIAILEN